MESNKHTLWNWLKTLISICKRPEFFPAKQESQEKTSNLTEQLTEVSVLIRIVWDSIRGAFNMLRSAVMRLHFEFRRYWIFSKTVCKRLESFSFGSKECGNTFGKVSAQPHTSLCIQSFVRKKQSRKQYITFGTIRFVKIKSMLTFKVVRCCCYFSFSLYK